MLHNISKGFSLIELMIVVGLISILAMIAIPSYQNYIKRARFAEVITATQIFKTAISLAIQQGTILSELIPGNNGIPEAPKKTKNLAELKVENGTITAVATELAANATYILKPSTDGSFWSVSGTCLKLGYCHG